MPGKHVHDPSLSVDGERHLGFGRPTIHGREQPGDCLVEGGVPGVDESAEITAVPSNGNVDTGIESGGNLADRLDPDGAEATTLDLTDRGPWEFRTNAEIDLTPTAPHPERTDRESELSIVHDPSVPAGAYLANIGVLGGPV